MPLRITIPCPGCCAACPNVPAYDLTLADTVICPTCITNGGGVSANSVLWDTTSFAGIFSLASFGFDPTNETWETAIATQFFDYFNTTDCSGSPAGNANSSFNAILACKDGKMSFRILTVDNTALTGFFPYFFLNNDITIGVPFSNELDTCDEIFAAGKDEYLSTNRIITSATGGTSLIELP